MSVDIYKLNNVAPDIMGNVLLEIERSFNIKLDNEGLKDVHTVDALCEVIINKINLEITDSCTTRHAFYLLRNAISAVTGIDKCSIKPQTRLSKIFPRETRLEVISEIENEIGVKICLLQPRQWIVSLFIFILAASFVECFYNWPLGAAGIIGAAIFLKIAGKFGKEIRLKTVGDLANKVSRETQLKTRHDHGMITKKEVQQKVKELLANNREMQPVVVRRRSAF